MSSGMEDQSHDAARLWAFARQSGTNLQLKALHERSLARAAASIVFDWLLIASSVWVSQISAWWIAPALIFVGNRQRALVVLVHDASHHLLAGTKWHNDLVARIFLCWPMFISLTHYRKLHVQHHRHLGNPIKDTDYLHDETLIAQGWWPLYRKQLFGYRNLRTVLLGQLTNQALPERAYILGFWALIAMSLYLATDARTFFYVLAIWFGARVFVYHPIISFVIISDHVGLKPGTVLSFTRNHPAGCRSWLLHPHANGWHLTHHLLPGLPCHRLPRAHTLLMGWPAYAAAEHCDRYFWGTRTVIRSWKKHVERRPYEAPTTHEEGSTQ